MPALLIVATGAISAQTAYHISTFAGQATVPGAIDGTGGSARFNGPQSVALDSSGNLYVADSSNHTIRKVVIATGVVTTIAGTAGVSGSTDGTGSAARFNAPSGVAVSSAGVVYVADTYNHTLRAISPAGVVTTLAGLAGTSGSADGMGNAARFFYPYGLAVDAAGIVYVADTFNHTIRRVQPGGGVTTLAGVAGLRGATNGSGGAARFNYPFAVATDASSNVFVADSFNHAIRWIDYAGNVTTLAGNSGVSGTIDGTGAAALFNQPSGIAADSAGNIYVADTYSSTIRRVNSLGQVVTLAGLALTTGSADGNGSTARFNQPFGLAANGSGTLYIADTRNHTLRSGAVTSLPVILVQPDNMTVAIGQTATFSSVVAADPVRILQWQRKPVGAGAFVDLSNDATFSGVSTGNLTVSRPSAAMSGDAYRIVASNAAGTTTSSVATLTVLPPSRLVNLSTRLTVPPEGVTAYFRVEGAGPKQVLLRGVGPTLGGFGVSGVLADPQLQVRNASGLVIASNDNWDAALAQAFSNVGAFHLSAGSKDAAILFTFAPGFYAVHLTGIGGTAGVALLEIYDATTDRSSYFSHLGFWSRAGTGSDLAISGFVVSGAATAPLVFRAVGPSMGIPGALMDPTLSLYSGSVVVAANDNWTDARTVTEAAKFGLLPLAAGSRDSALLTSLSPGSYTTQVAGVGGTTGWVLTEVFDTLAPESPKAPFIFIPPTPQAVIAGQNASFSVVAGGFAPLAYQWRRDGAPLAGQTSPTLNLAAFGPDAGMHDVVVTNAHGSIITPAVPLTVTLPAPPTITGISAGQSAVIGQSVMLMVTATGTAPLTYQWRKGSTPLVGATNATLTLANVQLTDSGTYDVVVSNGGGSVISPGMPVTVSTPVPPLILVHPVGGRLNTGNVGSFSVGAHGSAPLLYQWRKDGVALAGATNSTLMLGQVVPANAGTYDVVVSNLAGTATSLPAVLSINPAVLITSEPASVAGYLGMTVNFRVSATGTGGPSYQWRKDGVNIPGATTSTLILTGLQTAHAGAYDVWVFNAWGTTLSQTATLTVADAAPSILVPPTGATLAVGGGTTLSVQAGGNHPLTYQWRRNGLVLAGATNATLELVNAQTYQSGEYEVIVANALGIVSSPSARITVVPRVASYSARLVVGPEGAIGVFTIEGGLPKTLLLRAVGPGLAPFGLTGLMVDPKLEVFDAGGALVAANDNWGTAPNAGTIVSTTAAVGAFGLSAGSRDSAVAQVFAPGTYTVRAAAANGAGGVAYLEVHDADLATGPMSTIPFVAVRGRVAPGSGVVIGGMASNGRGQKSYLLRALGPSLHLPNAVSDPAFLVVRDNVLVAMNDSWDAVAAEADATAAASARLGLSALPSGGKDAALVLTGNVHAGPHTVQVNSPEGPGGLVLVELHDLDAARPTSLAPAIVSPPVSQTVTLGAPFALRVLATGTGPLTYQWLKDGLPVNGATTAVLEVTAAAASHGGSYHARVANAQGTSTSLTALVAIQSAPAGNGALHSVVGSGYVAGGTVTITNTLNYAGAPLSLGWSVTLPVGWSLARDAGQTGEVKPAVGATGTLDWAWSTVPVGPVTFTYTVNVPAGEAGSRPVLATGIVRLEGQVQSLPANPSPLFVGTEAQYHSADTNVDGRINLFELTRVIELFNTRNGTTRTGCYGVFPGSEDGFAPDSARAANAVVSLAAYHAADAAPRDGKLSLFELTRVIELFNTRSGTTRTGQYHAQSGTEDGFAPGP